jgi:hypothetical protein
MANLSYKETYGEGTVVVEFDMKGWTFIQKQVMRRVHDSSMWFREVFIPVFHFAEEEHFKSGGEYGGVGDEWDEPYSDEYQKKKDRLINLGIAQSPEKERLYLTMMEALTGLSSEGAIEEIGPQSVTVGADPVGAENGFHYLNIQQVGTFDGVVPPRPPVIDQWPPYLQEDLVFSLKGWIAFGEIHVPVV